MLRMVLVVVLGLMASQAAARQLGPPIIPLFISPAGEPFRIDAGEPYPVGAWFKGADANRDGTLSKDEFRADALRFFGVLDTNGDGRVAGREVSVYETELAPEILRRAPPPPREVADRRALITPRADKPLDRGVVPPELREGAGLYGLLNEPQPVTGADLDLNGLITRDEWGKAADRRFQLLDTNADGGLTRAELPQAPVEALLPTAPAQ